MVLFKYKRVDYSPWTVLSSILLMGSVFLAFYMTGISFRDKVSPKENLSYKEYYLAEFLKVLIFTTTFIGLLYHFRVFKFIYALISFIALTYPIYLLMSYIETIIKDSKFYDLYYTNGIMFFISFFSTIIFTIHKIFNKIIL